MKDANDPGEEWQPDLAVVSRFLAKLWRPDGEPARELSRSRLQAAVGLNYDRFVRYLDAMMAKGLVLNGLDTKGQSVLRLSPAGRDAYARLATWLREVFGDDRLL